MLDITPQDIAELGDSDLRTLVGMLCESQLRQHGLPTSAVTWGGHQNARDGGLDVRVALPPSTTIQGFVPRPATGFQVKKTDMPRGKILEEMSPKGTTRPVIKELANQSGAYVIVSSQGSTSDTALRHRREAMADAMSGVPHANSLELDFYDRTRLATWVRDYPCLIPWVREKIGKSIQGWRSYGAWANPSEGVDAKYLIGDSVRVQTNKNEDGEGLSVLHAIGRIRDLLRKPGTAVRLAGLSGVGKTRLVQALFEVHVEGQALDPSLALYTNLADHPDPQPVGLASHLLAARTRAVLVIDNCPPDLHRRLSELCRSPASTVSIVTVEYDIREDEPEGTEVFILEPSSIKLVEKLVKHRFREVSDIDAHTVAKFSGGNARVAIALAGTITKGDTISGLKDEELFKRLFQQRHEHDASLLIAAQACSLVYSFQGEDISSDDAELPRLGALAGKSAKEVFSHVAELQRRGLAQERSVWRAVLPHAIANRLATMALQNIPMATIEAQLIAGAPERLLKSFSRRLGYLHDSKEAVRLIEQWLGIDGLLGDVALLNDFGNAMFRNIAPAAPAAALAALERALNGPHSDKVVSNQQDYARLLRSIAFTPDLFDKSVALLLKLSATGEDRGQDNEAANAFQSLFYIYLSGTHAPIEQRLRAIQRLLQSDDLQQQDLGLKALSAALEAWHFTSAYSFEFGGRSRDHGYRPRLRKEQVHWYSSILKLVETVACSDLPVAPEVGATLAQKFRGLWTMAAMYEDLERVCRAISSKQPWSDGWIAARETLTFDAAKFTPEATTSLSALEELLRPRDLIQKVRYIVLPRKGNRLDLSDFKHDSSSDPVSTYERAEAVAQQLGKEVGEDPQTFRELLPELVCRNNGGTQLIFFGRGLCTGTQNPEETWKTLVAQLNRTPEEKQNLQTLAGFLMVLNEIDPGLSNALLDDAIESTELAFWFPDLQIALPIDEAGVARLKRSIAAGKAPIEKFRYLAWGRAHATISGVDFKELILLIAGKPNGYDAALEILSMRFHSGNQDKQAHDADVIQAGREVLRQLVFRGNRQQDDYKLGEVVTSCLKGEGGAAIAKEICLKLKHAVSNNETDAYDNAFLIQSLLKTQPVPALDALFAGNEEERRQSALVINQIHNHHSNPLDVIPENDLLEWCGKDPAARYPVAASVVTIFHESHAKTPLKWTDLALSILERAPDRVAVLKQFVRRFKPSGWSGSLAVILEQRAQLLTQLEAYPDPLVVEFVATEQARLRQGIERERQSENQEDKARGERFE